ncbi:MAG: CBS domain-containing protein [Candidatus Rokubacteria bacterium]|nr:CBS domain-containing protein [Candidatus Rokubacteria bacterium]MBI2554874.1 CBS domain-containing protein [Candidatus Rokubacteria bacterium]
MVAASSARPDATLTVAHIMVKPVVTATPNTPAGTARYLLQQARVRHLPVLEKGLLVGIVSDRDLRSAAGETVPLREIMTRTVFVLSPDTSVRQAARLFRERRFGAMPVLDGRELVGIVSVVDVLRVLGEQT